MQDTKCVIKQLTISSVEGEFENLFPLTSLLVNSMHEEDLAVMKLILFRRNVLLYQLVSTNKR